MAKAKDKLKELDREHIDIVAYNPEWPAQYTALEKLIKQTVPRQLMQRISHIGSTAVPGLSAKPIIDVQVEVMDLDRIHTEAVHLMEEIGFEFIWRPTIGDEAPFYAWFIQRNDKGERSAHIHMVQSGQASVDRIIFRDQLRADAATAAAYEALKVELAKRFPKDRAGYTKSKTEFIQGVLARARKEKMKK